jgi:DNA-binding CsgD family transcriptional regulator
VRALLVADQPERAEELLADAEATYRDLGAPFGIARTLLVRGTLRRRWGRHADGRADLELAEAMLTGIGADGWAAQASAARTAPAGTAPTFDRPEVLTPQELQVAGLVATGRSNREVADALFISVRTVESHLGRIYRKLDVRSRSQLIAGADGWGLRDQATW